MRSLLASTALPRLPLGVFCVVSAALAFATPAAAQMAGGRGGDGFIPTLSGGVGGGGGTTSSPNGTGGGTGHGSTGGGGGGGGGSVSLVTGAGGTGGTGGQSAGGGVGGTAGTAGSVGSTAATNNVGVLTGGAGLAGGAGQPDADFTSGGGGGGGGGGFGLRLNIAGTNSGSITGGSGGAGGAGDTFGIFGGTGGGGAGGGGVLLTGGGAYTNTAGTLQGGTGGAGGATTSAQGGAGGDGGAGAVLTAGGSINNSVGGVIIGGIGGNGGSVDNGTTSIFRGGDGGNGGVGLLFSAGGSVNNAGSITGGNGGAFGTSDVANGTGGIGGSGVVGTNLTIVNSGTIAGGLGSDGVTRANALTLSGASALTNNAGTLTGNIGITSGTLTLLQTTAAGATGSASYGNAITGGGALVITADANKSVTLVGTNTYTGGTTIHGGILSLGSAGALGTTGTISFTGGTLQYSAANTTDYSSRFSNAANQAYHIDTNGQTVTVQTALASSGGTFTKDGTGMLSFSGANTYSGSTTINAGKLMGAATNTFSATSATTINTGGTLDLGFLGQTINAVSLSGGTLANGALTGAVTSTGGVVNGIAGTASFTANGGTTTLTGTNSYSGATSINNGATWLAGAASSFSASSATTVNTGGTLDLGGFAQTIGSLAGGGSISLGSATLTAGGNNASTTFAGVLSGNGGFTKTGNGTFTLTNANSFAGVTTVSGGTLVLNNGASLAGSVLNNATFGNAGTVSGGVTNNATFNNNAGGVVAGALINAAGTFNNNAGATVSGLLTNSGTTSNMGALSGGLTNTAGITLNNGTIAGTTTITGGVLTGIGSVAQLSVVSGTFAPGNGTPGTSMTVTGNLALQSAAAYIVQLNPATASLTNVTGTASLGGASVTAIYASGSYVSKQYTIVSATGGVNGAFSGPVNTNLPQGFHSSLSYDANNAFLDLLLNFVPPPGTGLIGNQQNVGNAIVNFFNTNGGIPIVFGALTPSGLTQLSGEAATGSQQTTFNAMNQFMGVMTDPFIAGRGDPISGGGGPNAFAGEETLAYAGKRKPNDALAAIYTKAPPIAPSFEQRWSVWAAGFGGSQRTDGNSVVGSNDTRSSIYGAAVGADYRFSPNTIAGFALAGGGTNFSVNTLGGGRSDLFQAGAFVRHNVGPAYLTGALAYGWQDITTDRTVTVAGIDRLHAQFNANAWSGRIEGGYRYVIPTFGGLGITPYAAGQFTTFDLPAYAERAIVGANTFALAYGARSVTATRSELGLSTDKSFAMEDGVFTLRGRAAWAHDYNPDRSIAATFQTLPGASFAVNGARLASDSALVTASAEKKWLNGWSAAGTFDGEFSNVTTSYAGKGVVRYTW